MEHKERRNDLPSLNEALGMVDPSNIAKKTRSAPQVSDMNKLAPAANTEQSGIESGLPDKKLAYTAGTCDATPDQ